MKTVTIWLASTHACSESESGGNLSGSLRQARQEATPVSCCALGPLLFCAQRDMHCQRKFSLWSEEEEEFYKLRPAQQG